MPYKVADELVTNEPPPQVIVILDMAAELLHKPAVKAIVLAVILASIVESIDTDLLVEPA